MFPLSISELPSNALELAQALERGLGTVLAPPTGREVVVLEGEKFPELETLKVDVTGARVLEESLQAPRSLRDPRPAVSVERFHLVALPVLLRATPLRLELAATQMRFDYLRDDRDRLYLAPSTRGGGGGGEGWVRVEVGRSDLEALLMSVLEPIASANGIGLEDTRVELTAEEGNTVRVQVSATGKKLFVKARVHVHGRLRVDEELTATVDGLRCDGEGMLGEMAERLIQPRLAQFNGARVPLAGFAPGGLRLRELDVTTDDGIQVTAKLAG